MIDIANLIGDSGRVHETGGDRPFLLDRADKLWVVESGHVDVFSVRLTSGRPEGARQAFFTAPAGDILLGVDLAGKGFGRGMLAVGAFGTVLREIDTADFLRLGAQPSKADDIQRLIRRWIRNVSLAVGGKEIMRRNSLDLGGIGRVSVEEGGSVHPAWKTVWIRVESGRASFMGRSDFPEVASDRPFPLVKGAWLQALDETAFTYQEEWPDPEEGGLWLALESFSAFVLECAAANAKRAEATERARMLRREESQRSMMARGLSRLALILKPPRLAFAAEASPKEPLLAACRMVGRASGMEVHSTGTYRSEQDQAESLGDICRASGFRARQVVLRGEWWKRDNGPLLVYREADERPLAAIPASRRRYELLDPVDGQATPIDQAAAESLAAKAHVFYRPFPNVPLKGMDLVRLGIRGCRRDIATALSVGLCGALLSLLAPWMTGLLFDTIIPEAEGGQLLQLAAILMVAALVTLLFDITRGIALLRVEGRMDSSVQAALWDRLLSLPVPFFRDYAAGDLAKRSMGISVIRMILSGSVVTTILTSLFSIANLGLLFHYSPPLAWVAVGLCAAGLAFVLCVSLQLVRRQRRIIDLDGKNLGIILQLITGIAKLRVSGSENGAFSRWAEGFAEKKKHDFEAGTLQNVLTSFNAVYPVLALMALFMWLIWRLEGGLSTGGFLAFTSAFTSLQNAVLQMGMVIVSSLSIFPIYDRLRPIVETAPEADETKEKPGELGGRIKVDRLTYRYDPEGPLILKDVTVNVGQGEFVAIVGSSGSGKSTLLRLLLGFASPATGAIYYDGQDLASLDVRAVRRQIGVVLQNGQIMPGDIRTTILGSARLTLDDAWEAARMVGFDQDIREMPMGMYTVLSAGGGNLSGGQRQRLIIARAIVRKPRMLFFDEATSALDNRTQAIVSQSLERLQVSRVVIAHRLSTIVKADRIYVLEKGEIAEQGTYEELMELGGLFSELSKRQIA
jgi:NHLM bacteriocin system ABC transporter ATP-binding protein